MGGAHLAGYSELHGHFNNDYKERHAGDLGNIQTGDWSEGDFSKGFFPVYKTDWLANLDNYLSPANVDGKAIVVHSREDDFVSQPGGDAGRRLGCCRISKKGGL